MGQGGYLKIINASEYTLQLTHVHSYQMDAWDSHFPRTISPGQCPRLYVEWCENIFKVWGDDAGEAAYNIVGTNPIRHFEVQARYRHLQVDWQNTIQDPYFFPQPFQQVVDLGWEHDGTVTLTFCAIKPGNKVMVSCSPSPKYIKEEDFSSTEKKLKKELVRIAGAGAANLPFSELLAKAESSGNVKSKEELNNILCKSIGIDAQQGSILQEADSSRERLTVGGPAYLKNWMETYGPVIGHLPMNKLTLVCTHDAGTYDLVSPFAGPWAQCQDLDLAGQLNEGVRVLDLRLGCQDDKSGDERFILVHDTWRTQVTLKNALEQVKNFCSRNTREVVILDFHRFVELNGHFNDDELHKVITDTLGGLLYPYPNKIPSLDEIWNTSSRVIVAWNRGNKPASFFPGVDQKWYDKKDLGDLHTAIEGEMKKSHANEGFWSICAILTPTAFNPIHPLSPDVSNWFQAGSDWAMEANIIAIDYVEKTSLVQQAVSECLIKGVQP